jgi:hypothetical protein
MLGCTGSLSTRGIWLHCADVTQTRRPASFGVRPALFSFRYQIAARWTVWSRVDRTPVLPRSARQSHGLAETENSQSYCQLRGDPLENRGPDRRNRGGINLVQTAQNGDASPACDIALAVKALPLPRPCGWVALYRVGCRILPIADRAVVVSNFMLGCGPTTP